MDKYKLKITNIVEEAIGTKSYYFNKPEDLDWLEGAHVHIGLIGYDEGELPNKSMVRHMSITTLPEENKIGITTKVPGSKSEFKTRLAMLGIGDDVIFFKFGSRMYLRRSNRSLILLSMGVGIATIRPVIHAFLRDKTNIPRLINVNVNASGMHIYRNELDPLEDIDYINYWLDSRSSFYETLSKLSETPDAIYYIIGTDTFMKETIRFLNGKNILNADIVLDRKEEKLNQYFVEEGQTIE